MIKPSPFAAFLTLALGMWLPATASAQLELEDFFTCKSEGVLARVYVNPTIFCSNERINEATLLLEGDGRSNLYKGRLLRWESGNGETFTFSKVQDETEIETTLHLPYGIDTGVLATTVDGDIISSRELRCVTKQIHVDCANAP